MTTVYQTDSKGYFVHAAIADHDPLNEGQWLIPGGCVLTEPPVLQEKQAARWTGSEWVIEPDLRGEVYWTAGGQRNTITALGESFPTGALSSAPGPSAAQQWAEYRQQAQAALDSSDITILRCVENNVSVPETWASYRVALRAIVRATSGDPTAPLPTRPAYPAGT